MTAKPTAVVVRLPLSEENLTAFVTSMDCGEGAEEAILAIGTPVASGDFDDQKLDPKTKTPLADLAKMVINQRSTLAAAQAEIGRDSERLDWLESGCCDVRFRSEPIADTGDADTYCDIVEHHMREPKERVVGSSERLREAIDEARGKK